jgi:hypothetical protein
MDINIFANKNYREKLADKRWTDKKAAILNRDGACTVCGTTNNLIIHHKQYHYIKRLNTFVDPWDYDDRYLVVLCRSCHERGHEQFEIPIKIID